MTTIEDPSPICLRLDSAMKTLELGQLFAKTLTGGSILALTGELGSGKTQFTRGVGIGLGIPEDHITSPTFTLIQEYPASIPLIHIDLYRLETQADVQSLGLSEYFQEPYIVIIEWADRMHRALPSDHLRLQFTHGEHQEIRLVDIQGTGLQSRGSLNHLNALLSENSRDGFPHMGR
ncbi:MAG: tRNA (adenosine(37)-N6)-threonylcarbamoyltransferase complex ATPase subunit type 1 TsaE [Nitrospirales bacterium]